MSNSYARELAAALQAVRDASLICQHVQSQIVLDSREKEDRSPVTIADFASQAAVCRVLGELFPADPIIAEEDAAFLRLPENTAFLNQVEAAVTATLGDVTSAEICEWIDRGGANAYSERFWTLDPIDGTKGFLRKEQYAVSLALIVNGQIEVGVLGCPNLTRSVGAVRGPGLLYSAVRGQGAEVRPITPSDAAAEPIHVSDCGDPRAARLCESVESGHSSHDDSAEISSRLGIAGKAVRLDSQAKYAVVAQGDADVYLRLPTRKDYRERIWDHAGGVILVEEAGGRVSDVDGRPLDFTRGRALEDNRGVVVTCANLHDVVLGTVREVLQNNATPA
ncbi:MAG: 3'(2'),5'-bisphosphate nucleotidase [Planctomycetaceae bacterium]|nr:3'(2'),5'-bisphosphate nucleotidase [Planctomycetaceae bacterium]